MSSRTGTRKKTHSSNLNTFNQSSARPQVIHVRLNQPQPQVMEIKQNKDGQEENSPTWAVLRESSLILATATAVLFVIGWTYLSNWYAYFGVRTSQLNVQIPQILILSMPIIIVAFITLGVSYLLVGFLVFLFNGLKEGRNSRFSLLVRLYEKNEKLLSIDISDEFKLQAMFIFSLITIFLLANYIFPFPLSESYFEKLLELPIVNFLSQLHPALLIFMFVTLILPMIMLAWFILVESFSIKIHKAVFIGFLSILYLLSVLFMSARIAFFDAMSGRKGILESGKVQKVYLVSHKALSMMGDLAVSNCYDEDLCIYGPFGLIAENENSFFLAKSGMQQTTFPQNTWLYIMPRNDLNGSYSIVPYSVTLPAPVPASTSVPPPSPTVTATLQATLTPQPIITIAPTPTQP